MAYQVFLSYSQKDSTLAKEIARRVRKIGFVQVFLAGENLGLGHQITEKILSKIRSADLLLLFWSRNADRSQWVMYEIGIAFGANVKVLPLILTKSVPMPDFIRQTNALWMFPKRTESLNDLMSFIEREAKKKKRAQRIKAIKTRLRGLAERQMDGLESDGAETTFDPDDLDPDV